MKLYFDSTDNLKTIVKIGDVELVKTVATPQEQDVLGTISLALTQNQVNFSDLTEIEVKLGPGSFTGTRVGVAIGNALAFALNIPINGQKPPIKPIYGEPPRITNSQNKK